MLGFSAIYVVIFYAFLRLERQKLFASRLSNAVKTETHFFFGEKKKRFSISKKIRQGGFYKAAPLEPLLNREVKPQKNVFWCGSNVTFAQVSQSFSELANI
jgi:hypothetical protein